MAVDRRFFRLVISRVEMICDEGKRERKRERGGKEEQGRTGTAKTFTEGFFEARLNVQMLGIVISSRILTATRPRIYVE